MLKRITDDVAVLVTPRQERDLLQCTVTFQYTGGVASAPLAAATPASRGWFSWGGGNADAAPATANGSDTHHGARLVLGLTQFFGYMVAKPAIEEFLGEDYDDDDAVEHHMTASQWLSLRPKPLVGGKLGGIPHLENADETIADDDLYFVADLLLPFNSRDPQQPAHDKKRDEITYKELCEAVYPFHYTPQQLLFTDVELGSSAKFAVLFPIQDVWPPAYNYPGSLFSINYVVAVLFLLGMKKYTSYFPILLKSPRIGDHPRWLQAIAFSDIYTFKERRSSHSDDAKQKFLSDFDNLIDSDDHTVRLRKKSMASIYSGAEDDEIPEGFHPQLPLHFKTSYQLRVNNSELCLIHLTKPYYHAGEDAVYCITLNMDSPVKVIGYMLHLECQELFADGLVREYPVTGKIQTNTLAMALAGGDDLNGYINIPRWITHQFQLTFANVAYYLVFKFNIADLDDHDPEDVEGNDLKFRLKLVVLP